MSVTDPGVPDPLHDPRTGQADPGAYGQGEDLASTADDPAATGEDELAAGRDGAGDGVTDGGSPAPEVTGGEIDGGASEGLAAGRS